MIVYLIAVSKYGDIVGSKLVSFLKKEEGMKVAGVGGPEMKRSGLSSFSGIFNSADVNSKLSATKTHNEIINDILSTEPQVVVTIDNWDFCSNIHKRIRDKNSGIKQIHYIAPKIPKGDKHIVQDMANYLDFLITVFPREDKYFKSNGVDTKFAGYPIIERKADEEKAEYFRKKANLSVKDNVIAFLPGNNSKDAERMLPSFLEVSKRLKSKNEALKFIVATTSKTYNPVLRLTGKSKAKVKIAEEEDTYNVLSVSSLVITAVKGMSLDLAVNEIPHIVAYKPSFGEKVFSDKSKDFRPYTITNDLLEKKLVPIFNGSDFTVDNIAKSAEGFIQNGKLYKEQIKEFRELKEILNNSGDAGDNAAQAILSMVDREECIDGIRCIYNVEGR